MKLREMWQPLFLTEGGNLVIGDVQADRIDSSKRSQVVPVLQKFVQSLNTAYAQQHDGPIWNDSVIASGQHLAGSSFHFFNRPEITDEIFAGVKSTVGDIDIKVDKNKNQDIRKWLSSLPQGAVIGPAKFVGMDGKDSEQVLTLWQFPSIVLTDEDNKQKPITIQIDLEMKDYEDGKPTDWAGFSTSSSWEDLEQGIKGVFHKFLIQSLSVLTKREFMLQKYRKVRGKDEYQPSTRQQVTDTTVSFAIKSKEGGGLRLKYSPVIDDNGEPETENGLPVYKKRPTTNYQKDLVEIFYQLLDGNISRDQLKQQKNSFWSFIGVANMVKNSLSNEDKASTVAAFADKLFAKGAQGLYKGDPDKDREEKTVAIRKLIDILETKPDNLESMISDYYADYKKTESIHEAVATSKRKGVVHLEKMKDLDFLEFVEEIQNRQGNSFDLANIKMTVKIDGLGGRFGKDANGEPFFESSRSGPIRTAGAFSKYMQDQGVEDSEKLARAEKYDSLFEEIMDLINDVDRELGDDFLNNTKVHCEILYTPMATETAEGKLQYVSVEYDKLPDQVQLAVVPLFVEQSDSGNDHPRNDEIKQQLNQLGRMGDAMFIDNTVLQQGQLDVTHILEPLDNIDELKSIVQSRKRKGSEAERKQEVKAVLDGMKQQIAQEVVENPNIVGKYTLGDDYEGIILYTEKGPVKVTSPKFKELMKNKQQSGGKTAVVAYGNLMGHSGHQMLVDSVLKIAQQQNRTPFVYISPMVGPDDPVSAETKQATFQKLYPAHKSAFRIVGSGADAKGVVRSGGIRGAIKFDLVPEGYTDIVVVTGEDQADTFKYLTTDRALKSMGAESVTTQTRTNADSTEQGVRSTELRNTLKNPNLSYEQKLAKWMTGFDGETLGRDWIEKIMAEAAKTMHVELKTESKENPMTTRLLKEFTQHLDAIVGDRLNEMIEAEGGDLESIIRSEIESMLGMAQSGEDVTDTIADELGDYFDDVQASGNKDLQKVYAFVREKLPDISPEQQAKGLQKALDYLGSANENTFEAEYEDPEDDFDSDEPESGGFSQMPMYDQLAKILDSQEGNNPFNTVETDDGESFDVSVDQARALRLLATTEKVKPDVKQAFLRDIQTSQGLTDFLDQSDYHEMAHLFVKRYLH